MNLFLLFVFAINSAKSEPATTCNQYEVSNQYSEMLKHDKKIREIYLESLRLEKIENSTQHHDQRLIWGNAMQKIDRAHQTKLDELVQSCGWPSSTNLSTSLLSAAFMVIQHADLDYQLRYLPLIKESAMRKEITPISLAMLEDRILIQQGIAQKYGTQYKINDQGVWELLPVLDGDNLNKRRLEIGLTVLPGFP